MISGKAIIAGVIGWPIKHTLSPILHNYWLKLYKIDGAYIPIETQPENLEKAIRSLPLLGFAGANVTIPHKEIAYNIVDEATEKARRVEAVNTLIIRENGSIIGDNTDSSGFIDNLRFGLQTKLDQKRPTVVIGAGGAARSVVAALLDMGMEEIRIVNRTIEKAQQFSRVFSQNINILPWQQLDKSLENSGLLINATPLGMQNRPPLDIDLKALPKDAIVTDIVYTPLKTPLLKAALKRGNKIVDGLGMLIHQAVPGFTAWYKTEPHITKDLRTVLLGKKSSI
ncbi:MAG: Shikimate dehydrogenase (NADP(+)) [Alphaproteobacteria bacterium MarineAlpha3_Bin5]|nr:MAG: Shikimate dehydrogenase (NADP(+)) [Alphaproteobacteria bacterium MarineAlpha3_Bin5]